MKTTNETGHEQNVVNLEQLLTIVTTFGSNYNPPKPSLSIPGLNELLNKGKLAINAVNNAEVTWKNAIAASSRVLDDFDNLVTRSINSLRIAGVSAQTLTQAESIVRDLRGKRASKILSDEEVVAAKEKGVEVKQVVVHNSTIDSKIENLTKFVLFLEAIPEYHPNEPDITVGSLRAKLEDIKTKEAGKNTAEALLDTARVSRNSVLYTDNTGLVDIGMEVKLYTKSLFGADSPQFKQISKIKLTKR